MGARMHTWGPRLFCFMGSPGAVAGLLMCVLVTSEALTPVAAQERPLSELAFPLVVAPGDEVSFVLNATPYDWYAYAAAMEVGTTIDWWGYRDGNLQFGGMQRDLWGFHSMESGRWNLTFETAGRIAIVHELSGICGWQVTSRKLDEVVCPALQVEEATGFAVTAWSLDRPYVLRVQGEVDASFFDAYLRPLGPATERRYDRTMEGIVVVVPRSATASVLFSIVPAPSDASWPLAVAMTLAAVVIAVVVAVSILVAVRRRRKASQAIPVLKRKEIESIREGLRRIGR